MNNNDKINKGVGDPLMIIVLVTVILIAGVLLYYMFNINVTEAPTQTTEQEIGAPPVPTTSDSDEMEDLEVELEALDLGSIEDDIQLLEQESLEL